MATVSHVGAYEIQHQIGSGGMAPVFLATARTGRQVALKLLFIDNDHEGQQILEMERGGATLQEQFGGAAAMCRRCSSTASKDRLLHRDGVLAGRNLSEVSAGASAGGSR